MSLKTYVDGKDVSDKIDWSLTGLTGTATTEIVFSDPITVMNGDTVTFTYEYTDPPTGTAGTMRVAGAVTGSFSGRVKVVPTDDFDLDRFFIDDFVRGMREGRIEV
jgi:hypothetical protein